MCACDVRIVTGGGDVGIAATAALMLVRASETAPKRIVAARMAA
jgi:hypothetical protein